MTSNRRNLSHIPKPLICIYTNQNRNEFAIGLEKDENFRAITKVGESYARVVDGLRKGIRWVLVSMNLKKMPRVCSRLRGTIYALKYFPNDFDGKTRHQKWYSNYMDLMEYKKKSKLW